MCNHAAPERPETGREGPLYRWSVAFFRFLGYTVGEVIHMNKERLGAFIGERRRELGLTQKDLAGRLHVTDKAVSKWERGLSYPDVTLLEPLAGALDLNMEELMACRRQERRKEETPMKEQETVQGLLDISRDSVRRERRRSWQRLGAVLALLAITAAVAAYNLLIVREDGRASFLLAETVDGESYVYLQMEENHLLKLRCGVNTQVTSEDLTDERGDSRVFQISYRYNRLTLEGELLTCQATSGSSLGGPEAMIGSSLGLDYDPDTKDALFGYSNVFCRYDYAEADPFLKSPVFTCTYWVEETGEELLTVENVATYAQTDWDNDGESELAVRTIWAEKPYTIYDLEGGQVSAVWPDTVDADLAERLMTEAERQAELERQLQGA